MIDFILRPFRLNYGQDKRYYRALKEIFGIYPNNIELYKLALIHRSASLFLENGLQINNERLEFLGDAVLESIVSDYLFIEFPTKSEGFLTQLRSKIVSRSTLNQISLNLGLDKYIVVQYNAAHTQKHLYGDAFEAMIGAIYLDKGYDYTNRLVINKILQEKFNVKKLIHTETDFKSRVIEWAQKSHKTINFDTRPGPTFTDNHPVFLSMVFVDGNELGSGEGTSKKEAEQRASQNILSIIRNGELQ